MIEIQKLPDIASESTQVSHQSLLNWVGMKDIEVPIFIRDENGISYKQAAKASAFVSLDNPLARGIHMSRLYKEVIDGFSSNDLTFSLMEKVASSFLISHVGLSQESRLVVEFDLLVKRTTLKSLQEGFRSYPIKLELKKNRNGIVQTYLETKITYSSTCPASAALARQLVQKNFENNFQDDFVNTLDVREWLGTTKGILATPHAQRSFVNVNIQIDNHLLDQDWQYVNLINLVEDTLQTPVQSLVKREDEQEFALRNGQNLMFCEDAARKIKNALDLVPWIVDYHAELRHVESLHPHDAIAVISKSK